MQKIWGSKRRRKVRGPLWGPLAEMVVRLSALSWRAGKLHAAVEGVCSEKTLGKPGPIPED
jgi:hypothetical protein